MATRAGTTAPADGAWARGYWVWYVVVAAGQVSDVLLTRLGLSRGVIVEGNPFMAPIVNTPIPAFLKVVALAYLAFAIGHALPRPRPRALMLWGLRFLAGTTGVALVLHGWALIIKPLFGSL